MPYSKFTLPELKKKFGIQEYKEPIFTELIQVPASAWLIETLQINNRISMLSEKAKSELLVSPILVELVKQNNFEISVFSGISLDVDKKNGLVGECDFLIGLRGSAYFLESPVIALVEAKNDDINIGIPQCIAQMVAALQYNKNDGKTIDTIFGCVSTGQEWQFLKLQNNKVTIHNNILYINDLPQLLGTWQAIVDTYK